MNVNVWNIKEMLSTPTAPGPTKFSVRGSAHSDYSSLSDSQLLFGSQFCPENTQLATAPLELGNQLGQQNSQDSEPSIFAKYQTKPQLFDEDAKERGLLNFGAGKVKNVLENFEVIKNKIKDKYDRSTVLLIRQNSDASVPIREDFFEVLSAFMSSNNDKFQGLQAFFDKFEEMFNSRNKSILDHMETISKAFQDALQTYCDLVLKALTDKSQMEQTLLEMERRLAAKDKEISEVKSSIQLLKESLESLPAQLSDQHLKLCEQLGFLKLPNALAELQTFVSTANHPLHVTDSASQTSPGIGQGCALGKEAMGRPCCQGRRAGSSSCQPQAPCMAHQKGGHHTSQQLAGDGTCSLNAALGRKVSPAATAPCGKENTSLQEVKAALGIHCCASSPCTCCASNHLTGSSWENPRAIPQEVSLPTPLRKAVRRDTKGFKTLVTQSQPRQPQVCHLSVQKDMSGQKDKNSPADCARETTAAGNKARQKSGRNPRNKAAGWKKTCPARRRAELPRCSGSGMKQRMANKVLELEGSRNNCFPRYTVTLNSGSSNPVCVAPSERVLSVAQQRLSKSSLQGPCSNENMQQLVNKRKRSLQNQKGANVPNARRFFWDSSPQENLFSLHSTTEEKRVSCLSPPSSASSNKRRLADVLPQQNMACCSLVFDSDYSD